MQTSDAARLMNLNLIVPGLTQRDMLELSKAQGMRNPLDTTNRGTYISNPGDDWSYWGQGQPDRKPVTTFSFDTLRGKYRQSPIDKIIVMRRQMQVRKVARRCIVPGKQVGFRVVHERYADPTFKPDEDTIERCHLMERLICNVAKDVCRDVQQFASMMIKEELTIDRKVMLKFLDDKSGKPVSYAPIDGATVLPRIAVLMPWMQRNRVTSFDEAAEQMSEELKAKGIKARNGKEIDISKSAWIQVVNEEIVGGWTKDEMSVDIVNRDIELDQILYGKSCLEQSMEMSDLFLQAMAYNLNIFSPNFPEGIIVLNGSYNKEGIEGLKRTILMQTNASGSQRIPVVPADDPNFKLEWQKLRDVPKDVQFVELLRIVIAFKTASYGMHPKEINFSPDGGGQEAMINESDEGAAMEAATADGFNSSLDNMASWWTEGLIRPYFDDLIVVWEGLSTDNTAGRVDINVKELKAYKTLDEVRGSENGSKLVIPDDPADWDLTKMPLDPDFVQLANLKEQARQMRQQMAMGAGAQPSDPNGDYGEEQDDWHQAGDNPSEDHGQEPENWMMAGQVDKQGEPVKLKRPATESTSKSMRGADETRLKYIRLVLDDDDLPLDEQT